MTCPCCDGICGPQRGCNCGPCQKLDKNEAARIENETVKPSPFQPQLESWVWGNQPSKEQLESCISSLGLEQRILCGNAAGTTLSATRLRQRLIVFQRYFIALGRHFFSENMKPTPKKISLAVNHSKPFLK